MRVLKADDIVCEGSCLLVGMAGALTADFAEAEALGEDQLRRCGCAAV